MACLNRGGKDYEKISKGEYGIRFVTKASPVLTAVQNSGKLMIIRFLEEELPDTLAGAVNDADFRSRTNQDRVRGESRGCSFEILGGRCHFIKMIHKSFKTTFGIEAKLYSPSIGVRTAAHITAKFCDLPCFMT